MTGPLIQQARGLGRAGEVGGGGHAALWEVPELLGGDVEGPPPPGLQHVETSLREVQVGRRLHEEHPEQDPGQTPHPHLRNTARREKNCQHQLIKVGLKT